MSHVSEEVSVQLHAGEPDARIVYKKINLVPVDNSMDKCAERAATCGQKLERRQKKVVAATGENEEDHQETTRQQHDQITC